MSAIVKVLWVSANPVGTAPLMLEEEGRAIAKALEHSPISLTSCRAARVQDLQDALIKEPFQLVHISAMGNPSGSLELTGADRLRHLVPQAALAKELAAYTPTLQCVVLNACYSKAQGSLISMGVPFTIAMDGLLGDLAAIEFSGMFYSALASGRPVEFAYQRGCSAVALMGLDMFNPSLLRQGEVAAAGGVPAAPVPGPLAAPPEISIRVESTRSTKYVDIRVSTNMSLQGLLQRAREAFDVPDQTKAGILDFPIAWVLVDAKAEPEYRALDPDEKQRLRAYVKTPAGIAASYDAFVNLGEAGVYDGITFHLYVVADTSHGGGAGPLGFDEKF